MGHKSQIVCAFITMSFVISGCSANHNGSTNLSRVPAGNPPIENTVGSACYNGRCLKTMPINQVTDLQDYIYQNPNLFPTASLRQQYVPPTRLIDLLNVSAFLPLSKSFDVGDFMDYRHGRYAIFSRAVVNIMQDIQNETAAPIWITSGYRSPAHNAQVGGVLWSRHQYGDAVDFTTPSPNYKYLQSLCLKYDASFTLIYTNHIHCDWRKYPLDPAFYTYPPNNNAPAFAQTETPPLGHLGTIQVSAEITDHLSADGSSVKFGVTMKNEDLEGEMVYSWTITNSLNETHSFDSPTVSLPVADGPYRINVIAGGFIHLQKLWPAKAN